MAFLPSVDPALMLLRGANHRDHFGQYPLGATLGAFAASTAARPRLPALAGICLHVHADTVDIN